MSPEIKSINDIVQRLLGGLAKHAGDVELVTLGSAKSVIVDVRCNAADCQKVIGKHGAHFRAVSLISERAADHLGVVYKLRSLLPSVKGKPDLNDRKPFAYNPDWPKKEIENLLKDTLQLTTGSSSVIQHEQDKSYARMRVKITANDGLIDELRGPINKLFHSIGIAHGVAIIVDI